MIEIAEGIFLASIIIIFYTYLGYPLLLLLLTFIKKTFTVPKRESTVHLKTVTLIIAAYNEEDIIEEKIRNTLNLTYPPALLKVIFITDGSTDKTRDIIKKYPQVALLHEAVRRGKVSAMNRAMKYVESEIVVFSDANGLLNNDCLQQLVKYYDAPGTGAVSGEKKVLKNRYGSVGEGEGLYWKYESLLKKLDAELYTVVGAAGELFSIRTKLYVPLPENIIIEDFVQSLLLCMKGYVVKYEPLAWSQELASYTIRDEMERKVRISAGAFQAMVYLKQLFNVYRYPLVFFQYFSHRVLRWTITPLALVLLFIASVYLYLETGTRFYGIASLLQLVFYVGALLGWKDALSNRKHALFYLPFYFLFMNFCVFAGFFRYLSKRQETVWKKASRN